MKRVARIGSTLLLISAFALASFANVAGTVNTEKYNGSRHRVSRRSKRVRVARGSIYARRVRRLNRSQIREVYKRLIDIKVD